jgi:hypothetical protein
MASSFAEAMEDEMAGRLPATRDVNTDVIVKLLASRFGIRIGSHNVLGVFSIGHEIRIWQTIGIKFRLARLVIIMLAFVVGKSAARTECA